MMNANEAASASTLEAASHSLKARDSIARDALRDSDRRHWLGVLARAPLAEIERHWHGLEPKPGFGWLRPPETGMVMVRGRIGGTGDPFNLGEMTVTRCAVCLADGATGLGYVKGRSARHAELMALLDAMLQTPSKGEPLRRAIIAPLEDADRLRAESQAAKVASTQVEFFTVVRGAD